MVVAQIDASDVLVILADSDGVNTTSPLFEFESLLLLSCLGAPGESNGRGTDLSGSHDTPIIRDRDGYDAVRVTVHIIGCIL